MNNRVKSLIFLHSTIYCYTGDRQSCTQMLYRNIKKQYLCLNDEQILQEQT